MDLQERISAFAKLGEVFRRIGHAPAEEAGLKDKEKAFIASFDAIREINSWFDRENILFSFYALGKVMDRTAIESWLHKYPELNHTGNKKKIGVVMAGNIPLVGFHDFMSVLITGNRFFGKTSTRDGGLHEAVANKLIAIEPRFSDDIAFTQDKLSGIDAVIATGSDNTARHFSWLYRGIPALIRKNMNSLAILNGSESSAQLESLSDDIFRYYGLGCRSVSKIFVPDNYDFTLLFRAFEKFNIISNHTSYRHNLLYQRANLAMEGTVYIDGRNILLTEHTGIASPVGVIYYQSYRNTKTVHTYLTEMHDKIQCIVADSVQWPGAIPFGQSQFPALDDYADREDTIRFILSIP
ncbi:MAG: acyl-CoA reductase [Chlorobi bacterium]|nr:acyl-CoA reductase [Chlorobiota bacterium]